MYELLTIQDINVISVSFINILLYNLLNNIVPCWRYLQGLQTTPLNCSHYFIRRLHSSVVQSILCTQFWPPDVLSRGGPLMSSPLEGWLLTLLTYFSFDFLYFGFDFRCWLSLAPKSLSLRRTHADGVEDTSRYRSYSLVTISLLRKRLRCVWNVGIRNRCYVAASITFSGSGTYSLPRIHLFHSDVA
jgi:hypothetical protein